MKYEFERIDRPDDPRRCQAVNSQGQCMNRSVEHSQYCAAHGGNSALIVHKKKELSVYRLAKYQVRLKEMSQHDRIKNLTDEIGILRILMEELLNKCDTDLSLMQRIPQLADLAMKIGKLVEACAKLDRMLGQYITKNDAVQLGMEIVGIIGDEIKDVDVLDRISEKICGVIDRITSERDSG